MPKLHLPRDLVDRWVCWVLLVWHPKSLVMDGKFIFRTLKRIAWCWKGLVQTRPSINVISALRAIMAKEEPKRASWPPNMKLFGKVATAAAAPATAATAPTTETAACAPEASSSASWRRDAWEPEHWRGWQEDTDWQSWDDWIGWRHYNPDGSGGYWEWTP